MSSYKTFTAVLLCCILVPLSAQADGMIYQLPGDGTWARYAGEIKGTAELAESRTQPLHVATTLKISSVGEVTRDQQKCRWIELKVEASLAKAEDDTPTNIHILKLLVPEQYLKRGEDPLAHALVTHFNKKAADRANVPQEKGFDRTQYEIDRFRPVFPPPLDGLTVLEPKSIDTEAGRFDRCEVLSGSSKYDGPLAGGGRSEFEADYRVFLHPDAPFGVVSMTCDFEGKEISGSGSSVLLKFTQKLVLEATGKNAVSELANATADLPDESRTHP